MTKESLKKALSIAYKVFTWIVIAITVAMMIFTIFSSITFDRHERNLFGIRFYIVLSDSMSPSENNKDDEVTFDSGDLILVKMPKDPTKLEEGDIISFISQNPSNFMETVTHKIYERVEGDDGKLVGYRTYGTNTGEKDPIIVEPKFVLGVYAAKIPKLGYFFDFVKSTVGYIVCILVPFLILIFIQGLNTVRLFKRYKGEQNAQIEAEREQLRKEREETALMMRELEALKKQLLNKDDNSESGEDSQA